MIRAVDRLRRMAPYALADLGESGLVSLAQNESAFDPSPRIIAAGRTALARSALYPDPDWTTLRRAIAETHGLASQAILCGAGSMELIGALIHAFAGPGDQVLGSAYGYLFVATACAQSGADYLTAPEPDYTVSVDALLEAVTHSTRVVFVCNPGNPTGTRLPNAELLRLRNGLPADVLLVIDQAYAEFDDQDHAAILALPDRGDSVVTRTFSKAYGLAGARVGWGVFPDQIAQEVRKLLNPNNISGVSQAMAEAAVRDRDYMASVVAQTGAIRDRTTRALRATGLRVPESHTNFMLIDFGTPAAATAADAALRAGGLLLRGMGGYDLAHCLRATIGSDAVMVKLERLLRRHREGQA